MKINLLTFIFILLISISFTFASDITIKICKEKDYDCQYIKLSDVKKIDKIANGDILRITFYNGNQLDINVSNKYYEIKK